MVTLQDFGTYVPTVPHSSRTMPARACPPHNRHCQPGGPESFGMRRKALGVLEMDGISVRGWHLRQDALILLRSEGIVNNNVVILLLFGEWPNAVRPLGRPDDFT